MEKIARVPDGKYAQLWINHDKPSSDARHVAGILRVGEFPDLSFTETAHGAEVINAGGEDLFWKYGVRIPMMSAGHSD
jgi:hypothetical protein